MFRRITEATVAAVVDKRVCWNPVTLILLNDPHPPPAGTVIPNRFLSVFSVSSFSQLLSLWSSSSIVSMLFSGSVEFRRWIFGDDVGVVPSSGENEIDPDGDDLLRNCLAIGINQNSNHCVNMKILTTF
jgi:hypothetical protein